MLIKKYTSECVKNFTEIKREIEGGLYGIEHRIEHIGSTSVPQLDSIDIIDIDIIYDSDAEFGKIKAGLIKIGYYHNGNQGIEQREVFKQTRQLTNRVLDSIKHHLYVCPRESKALERHILSRNFLRTNDWARLKYQEIKYDLAEEANQDKKCYAYLKELHLTDFMDAIIEKEKRTHNTM
ncbi:MAG: GrpB family protein [Bacteroidota bacterium]